MVIAGGWLLTVDVSGCCCWWLLLVVVIDRDCWHWLLASVSGRAGWYCCCWWWLMVVVAGFFTSGCW